jgi:16S rRNA (cytosine1407-C5)-methyltransferase
MVAQTINIFPPEFLSRLELFISKNKLDSVLESFTKTKPISFRTNLLKTDSQTLVESLKKQNIQIEIVPWYPDAFVIKSDKTALMATDEYKQGHLYIQNLSSMIPPLVLKPRTRDIVCDLTAAPGSKTTQLAMMMKNKGKIVANDISRTRLFRLRDNLKQQGVTNTFVSTIPGQALWKKYTEHFDKTLVDAPCTMEGRFSTLDPDSYKDWTPKKAKMLSKLQKFLLRSAISLTKPGGLIVYSTCTLEPEENEEVIDWILEKEKGNVTVETIDLNLPETMPGITNWKNKTFDAQVAKTLRIVPSETMEGFYVAALRKNGSSFDGSIFK